MNISNCIHCLKNYTAFQEELFIQHMTRKAHLVTKSKELGYKELAEIVQDSENMTFLREILPKKITVEEYRKIVKEKEKAEKDIKKKNNDEDV